MTCVKKYGIAVNPCGKFLHFDITLPIDQKEKKQLQHYDNINISTALFRLPEEILADYYIREGKIYHASTHLYDQSKIGFTLMKGGHPDELGENCSWPTCKKILEQI